MITTIRSQLKQSTYRYVVFFLVSVIALSMVSSLFIKQERRGVAWAIRVNGSEISYQDFSREVAKQSHYLAQIRAQYGQYAELLFQSMGWTFDPKVLALDILIKEELLTQYGQKLGIKLHPDYINRMLNNAQFAKQSLSRIVPPFVFDQSGTLDMNAVKMYLQQNKISAQQFETAIERALIQQQALDYIAASSYTPTFDIKQQFIAQHLNKSFSYLTFSFDHYLTKEKKNALSDEDIQSFYDAQNTQFRRYWVPEKRNGKLFKFKPEQYNSPISEEEIQEYYEDNKMKSFVLDPLKVEVAQLILPHVAQSTNKTVEEIEKDIADGKLGEYEQYWKTLKPFARGERKGEFEKNAFLLQNSGELSPVFETKEGATMLKLVKRIPRTYKPLINVKKEIEIALLAKAFKKNFVKDIKHVLMQDDENAWKTFIKEKAAQEETISDIFKDESQLSQQLFSLKKGQYGFFVENGIGIAVQLTDTVERHLPDLASVKDVVKNDLHEYNAKNTLRNDIEQARQNAQTFSFAELKKEFDVQLSNIEDFNNSNNKKVQELSKKGLPVHEMMGLEKENSLLLSHGERNSFLIKLDSIEAFDEDKFLSLEKEVKDSLGPIRTRLLLESAVASLHRNATIETNESILITNEEYSE